MAWFRKTALFTRLFGLIGLWLLAAPMARADGPEDVVKWIYTSLAHAAPAEQKGFAYISSRAQRVQFFSQRMVDWLDANDTYGGDLASACIDFALDIPGQDFAENEIIRTLTTEATGDAQTQRVVARFTNFLIPAEITYDFIVEDGLWRIDDMAGPGWRVSQIPCAPKGTQVAEPVEAPGQAYCYDTGTDNLRIETDSEGNGSFRLESYQANGHGCFAEGPITSIPGGWVYEAELDGGPCRIELRVTPEQGIRLSDPDWACKPSLCGQRAYIDELTLPRESQVHCVRP